MHFLIKIYGVQMNSIAPPVLGLRLGVIGNRDLSGVDIERVRVELNTVLTHICSGTEKLWQAQKSQHKKSLYADEPPRFFLIDSLADGADQLAAQVIRKLPYKFQLSCPIPFPRELYKKPFFTDQDRSQFDELVKDERFDTVVIEMNCNSETEKCKAEAYRAAADMLLDNTDLLIAIYDPDKEGHLGGTVNTVNIAQERRIPVIHLNTKKPDEIQLYQKGNRFEDINKPISDAVINQLLKFILLPASSLEHEELSSEKTGKEKIVQILIMIYSVFLKSHYCKNPD